MIIDSVVKNSLTYFTSELRTTTPKTRLLTNISICHPQETVLFTFLFLRIFLFFLSVARPRPFNTTEAKAELSPEKRVHSNKGARICWILTPCPVPRATAPWLLPPSAIRQLGRRVLAFLRVSSGVGAYSIYRIVRIATLIYYA
jgi:hypothetical protein